MPESVIYFKHVFYPGIIEARAMMLRPGNDKSTLLVKKCLHVYLNGRPCNAT